MLAFPWQGKIVKSEICSCRWTTRKMWQGYYWFAALVKENLSYFLFTLPRKTCQGKTCQGKLASVYSRQVFLDKWTCQGKIARVNGALVQQEIYIARFWAKPRWSLVRLVYIGKCVEKPSIRLFWIFSACLQCVFLWSRFEVRRVSWIKRKMSAWRMCASLWFSV